MIKISVGDLIKFKDLFGTQHLNVVNISRKHLSQKDLSNENTSSYHITMINDNVIRNLFALITKVNNMTILDPCYRKRYCEIQFLSCHDYNEYSFLIVHEFARCIRSTEQREENSFQCANVFNVFDKKISMHIK